MIATSLAENQPRESADDRGNGDANCYQAECVREEGFITAAYGEETVKIALNKPMRCQVASAAAWQKAMAKVA